jgi:hypothetical protein
MPKVVNKGREQGVPVPPPDLRPYVPQITLPNGRECAFQCLHPSVVGFWMHWVDEQHYPHRANPSWCSGCLMGQTPHWNGYIGVLSLKTFNRYVMRIPTAAFRESGLFREKSESAALEGVVFTGWRFGKIKARNNPAVIELLDYEYQIPKPKPFPLFGALSRYWRMENLGDVDQVSVLEDFAELRRKWLEESRCKAEAMGLGKRRANS